MATVTGYIQEVLSYAQDGITNAENYIEQALFHGEQVNWIDFNPNYTEPFDFQTQIPAFGTGIIPNVQNDLTLVKQYSDDMYDWWNKIFDRFFADIQSFNMAEEKLQNFFINGYIIQQSVRNQIIDRAREEEIRNTKIAKEKALNDFQSLGWSKPNSFLYNQIDNIEYSIRIADSKLNRDIAIKDEEMYLDFLKFAIQESLNLLPECIKTATSFANQWSQIYNLGAENARVFLQGLATVEQSIQRYDNTTNERMRLKLQNKTADREYDTDTKWKKSQFDLQKLDFSNKLTLAGVSAYTEIGKAGMQSLNAIIGLSESTANSSI